MDATEAVPTLYRLLNDNERSRAGEPISAGTAAQKALTRLEDR